ncbi:CFS1-like protein [Lentinula edodes]|uniref:CFS1-like protein n=1 Tax=Lentinula lateritia TaxID=40482 RepID=A0A9W8ZRL0_9AGAR|nr:CFS1-like protein [Lentinula edodes]
MSASTFTMHPQSWQSSLLSRIYLPALSVLSKYARRKIFAALSSKLVVGQLIIRDEFGTHVFGTTDNAHEAVVLQVHNERIWARLLFSLDIGMAEAYMEQEVDISDLKGLFNLWIDNQHSFSNFSVLDQVSGYLSAISLYYFKNQSISMSHWNVHLSYDTSNNFFKCFLSEEMMYSCAIWGEPEGGVAGDLTESPGESVPGELEAAQRRKITLILDKARLRAGYRVLEIGSGWGAMAISVAQMGCSVDTVTLSIEQKKFVECRAKEAGVTNLIRVHLLDYRQLPKSFEKSFDAFISCEMIEAVGRAHLPEYFKMIDYALKNEKATAVITATTQPEFRYSGYQTNCFARHYHWPNTFLPNASALPSQVQAAIPGRLVLYNLEDHNIHYPRTLREWARHFEKNFGGKVVKSLQLQYPELQDTHNLEAFKRKWMYMFRYAEVGYARAYTSINCWTFTRPGNIAAKCS